MSSILWVLCVFLCAATILWLASCGGGSGSGSSFANSTDPPPSGPTPLTASDVTAVVEDAVQSVNAPMVVAVADRGGNILAIFDTPGAPATTTGNFNQVQDAHEVAVALARTAAFFSNDQAPLSSRTVRFISGIHFPPGVAGTANGDLYGIENTNRGCTLSTKFLPGQALNPSRSIDGTKPGLGILTGKADANDSDPMAVNPGGVPLFKGGAVGGVGVVSTSPEIAEYAAFSGATNAGLLPSQAQLPPPGVVIISGIALPFVNQTTQPAGTTPGTFAGTYFAGHSPVAGALPPESYLVGPNAGTILSKSDVSGIISNAVSTAEITRAVIRLPPGSRAKMSIAVADLDGTILALYRMPDGTVFSADVAASKARNVVWFSTAGVRDLPAVPGGTAVTNRTVSFGAQPLFPPGIDGSGDGPFFQLYLKDTANPCTQGSDPGAPNTNNMSGIVFFPGSLPLYRNGVLVGGLGVSGDGVSQDDFVTAGAVDEACGYGGPCNIPNFEAPTNIRADQVVIRNVRLPYLKFPRNPTD
ncbi:MAG TPA: heme-binding protein [Terriglobales bacterium]|nr:heme-binding protein [Terriglobales bacterium]